MREFKEIGENVEIFEPISLIDEGKISIKNNSRLSEFTLIMGGLGVYIGNYVHVANHVSIAGGGVCIIEDFVGVCAGVRIITGSDDITGKGIPSPLVSDEFRSFYRSHVVCKKHSFIGTNAVIHPGVTIGEGAVVASGSLVTKDLEPWSIYMGAPARKIRSRNSENILSMEEKIYKKNNIKPSNFDYVNL
ncbi:acyltransferase [Salinimicrobium sp. GXAS 041]|uniref:acyltransferase n=1 Tax=Salinimicrobium sp. GXAS 041 TaxID=3400806 RepID=UPI003C75B17E